MLGTRATARADGAAAQRSASRPGPAGRRASLAGGDRLDLFGGALELGVGEHGGALEGQFALELDPGLGGVVLVLDLDCDRPRDAVGAQQQHVQRLLAALPGQPLLGVVARPYVEGGERVDAARVGDREVPGHLGPRADAHAVGLRELALAQDQGVHRRLAVAPDALLERAAQLGLVGLADEVARLVLESRIQEETFVREPESACPSRGSRPCEASTAARLPRERER